MIVYEFFEFYSGSLSKWLIAQWGFGSRLSFRSIKKTLNMRIKIRHHFESFCSLTVNFITSTIKEIVHVH